MVSAGQEDSGTRFSFKAFLSHRYKSPVVNLYFFELFSELAEVQFEVDVGSFATNITRLERMIRDSDAFIGIYPFPSTTETAPSRDELLHESRYFRLELELAIRSQRPALVLYDKRYRNILRRPQSTLAVEFDPLEITSAGGFPSEDRYRRAFRAFCDTVMAWKRYTVAQPASSVSRTAVALALPTSTGSGGYPRNCLDLVQERLEAHGYSELRLVPHPLSLEPGMLALFQEVDWALVEIGDSTAAAGVAAFLHGCFTPSLRLLRLPRGHVEDERPAVERLLYGGTEVGYTKDIVRWRDAGSLRRDLDARLASLDAPSQRISTAQEAETYFRSTSLRNESVFLSYSGIDEAFAGQLSTLLKKEFQLVFDYKDGKSIRAGEPWMEEIFAKLSVSAIGFLLLSPGYLASGNCLHEAREMVARRDSGEMAIMPVKLGGEPLELPPFLKDLQYLRSSDYDGAPAVAAELVRFVDGRRAGSTA